MYLSQQVSIKKKFSVSWNEKNGSQKLMADDDEVFEVTAISEQLDLRREICTNKKCSNFIQDQRKGKICIWWITAAEWACFSNIEVGRLLLLLHSDKTITKTFLHILAYIKRPITI